MINSAISQLKALCSSPVAGKELTYKELEIGKEYVIEGKAIKIVSKKEFPCTTRFSLIDIEYVLDGKLYRKDGRHYLAFKL